MLLSLVKLFGLMFGIGALTFGGGYAIVGVLQNYLVGKLAWMTLNDFTTGLIIGQVTPGPLSTMVAFCGYKVGGVTGAILASIGLLLPSLLCSMAIAKVYEKVKNAPWVPAITKGLSLAIVALLAGALVSLIPGSLFKPGSALFVDPWAVLIAIATFYVCGPKKKDPLIPFAVAAVVGAFLYR